MGFKTYHNHEYSAGERKLMQMFEALDHSMGKRLDKMSKEIDDLNAAVDKMTTAVTAASAEIETLVTEITDNSDDPAAVEAAAQKLSALADSLTSAIPASPAPPAAA